LRFLWAKGSQVDAVLLGTFMPNRDGYETLTQIRRADPGLPVIVISGDGQAPAQVVHAMKCGATDFLCKPVGHEALKQSLEKAVESRQALPGPVHPPQAAKNRSFIGASPKIREIQEVTERIGWCEAPVLIQGETGSGKEVLAREL